MKLVYCFFIVFLFWGCSPEDDDDLDGCWAYIEHEWTYVRLSEKPVYTNLGDSAFVASIIREIRYPSAARENGIEGTVTVEYQIDTLGQVDNRKIVMDIGGGCGDEVIRAVTLATQGIAFSPAKYRQDLVRVKKELDVKFKLQ